MGTGSHSVYTSASGGNVLNCKRGGEYQVDVVSPSVNATTPEDMSITLFYRDKNQKAFTIYVAPRGSYKGAYVTRNGAASGASCYWKYSSGSQDQVWYLH